MTRFGFRHRKVSVLALSLVLLTMAQSCQKENGVFEEETITVGYRWEPRTFNPFRSVDSASYFAQSLVYCGLVRYGKTGDIEPDLADSFLIDQSKTVYSFNLRKGLRFSDGSPISSDDVVRSIREAVGKGSPFRNNFQLFEDVTINGQKITVKFKGPDVSLLSRFVDLKILPQKVLEADKKSRAKFDRNPVCSGAFVVRDWISGQQIIFERNSHYWGKKPEYKKLAWRVIPDKKLLAMALMRKEIDIASLDGRETRRLLKVAPDLVVEELKGARVVFLGFNTSKWPFNDVLFRQSICMMIDRKKINEKLYGSYSVIPSSEFETAKQANSYPWAFNPSRANSCVLASGFVRTAGGLYATNGMAKSPLTIKVVTVTDFFELGQAVVSSLRRRGIICEIEIVEYSTLKDQYLKEGQFDMVLFSRSVGPVPDARMFWSSTSSMNYSKYHNPQVDKLIAYGSNSLTISEKEDCNKRIGEILAKEVPWIYLSRPELLLVHQKGIKNVLLVGQKKLGLPWNNELLNARYWTKGK